MPSVDSKRALNQAPALSSAAAACRLLLPSATSLTYFGALTERPRHGTDPDPWWRAVAEAEAGLRDDLGRAAGERDGGRTASCLPLSLHFDVRPRRR